MNRAFFRNLVFIASILLTVSSCGGGAGGGVASGGTGGTGISSGSITGFGSIFVNGVEFSTSSADIRHDDDSFLLEDSLRRGMTVEVHGSIDDSNGTANAVIVEEVIKGPVVSTAPLVVLGQTVLYDETTCFDDGSISDQNSCPAVGALALGDIVEVHGFVKSPGVVFATFIEKKNQPPLEFVVRGFISAPPNDSAKTFNIGDNLTVDYATASRTDMPPPANWDGLFVEVKGLRSNASCTAPPACTWTASKVEPEGLELQEAAQAEIEGFVTAVNEPGPPILRFTVNSQLVEITGSTVFENGLREEIREGVKLEVEGSLATDMTTGVVTLTASKIEFKRSIKLESNATVSGSTIALEGLPGITVTVDSSTEFEVTTATASNLAPLRNRNVRIRGRVGATATSVIATEIEDRGPSVPNADVILQGLVNKDDVSEPTFKILGVTVNTSRLDDPADFQGVDDQSIGSAAFFAALRPNGGLVKAKGTLPGDVDGNAMAADWLQQVELED